MVYYKTSKSFDYNLPKFISSFFQESLPSVFNTLFSGSRAFVVWSTPIHISCSFGFKRVYFHLNG
jgi:hypothetical protein